MTEALLQAQNAFEQRFNCIVCLCPKLNMVYGICQHKVCETCLYDDFHLRRPSFSKCPTCQKEAAFPFQKPDIPEDNIEQQKALGIRTCSNKGCSVELWDWELEDHLLECPNKDSSTPVESKRRKSQPVIKNSKSPRNDRKPSTRLTRSQTVVRQERNRPTPRRRTNVVMSYLID